MAYFIREIKFFEQKGELYAALFDMPPLSCSELWVMNVPIRQLGLYKLPETVTLEQKYPLESLGLKPIYFDQSLPQVSFIDPATAIAWKG